MWLAQACQDSRTGLYSSKRIIAVWAAFIMGAVLVILAGAAYRGRAVDGAILAVAGSLAALAGVNYVGGKMMEGRRNAATGTDGDK